MAFYTERAARFAVEGTFGFPGPAANAPSPGGGAAGSWATFTYATRIEATTSEGRSEEAVVAGARDQVSRVFTRREVTGVIEQQLVGPTPFYYAMGSVSTDASSPYTITLAPYGTIPSFSMERYMRDFARGETIGSAYWGCKLDSLELNLEAGEVITLAMNFVGRDSTVTVDGAKMSDVDAGRNLALIPFSFHQGNIAHGGTLITQLNAGVIRIENNLAARWAVNLGVTPGPSECAREIREGLFRVSGRMTVGESLDVFADLCRSRAEFDVTCTLATATYGTFSTGLTMVLTLQNAAFEEYPDMLDPDEQIEAEFPFMCRPDANYNVISISVEGPYGTLGHYYM